MFKEIFTEKTQHKIYYQKDTLWVAHGEGSGITSYMPDITKYLTDKKNDSHYDSIVNNIVKALKDIKPIQTKKNATLIEVPYYPGSQYGVYLDIWGGDLKPTKNYYMIITKEKDTIVNIFDNKNEAKSWMKSIN